ncbi:MAG: protein kinase [Vicinamibacterales bacterium]
MATPSPEHWSLLSRLQAEDLDLAPEARPAWLDALASRDPEAAAAVAPWVGEFAAMESRGFLEDRAAPAPAAAALVGLEVGAYRLVELLGQGGMGAVWLAERSDGQFAQKVAVKLLHAALTGSAGAERFAREAAILARLTHPNISRLLDAGLSAVGAPYLVLEFVQGAAIDGYCDARRLGVHERLYLFLDVLATIGHAHANLVVHRDIKPGNVLVTDDGHVKLLDFGIAKLLQADPDAPTVAATQGTAAMTPAYAAPEQLTGGAITTATDVYALGVLLYQLLTGRHPSVDEATTPASLVQAVLYEEPARASEIVTRGPSGDGPTPEALAWARGATPDRLAARLAGDLDTILAKAMKKAPAERYASVAAFEDDLRRWLRHEPIAARPDTLRYRIRKFARRHRASVAFAALAVVALLAGLAGTLTQARRATAQAARADEQAAEATAQRDFARRQLARAEAINDLNAFLIADAAPLGTAFTPRELLERAERIVGRQGDDREETRTDSMIAIAGMFGNVGETTRALTLMRRAYEAARTSPDPTLRGRAACELGREVVKTGDIARARQLVEEGLAAIPARPEFGLARAACHLDGASTAIWADDGDGAVAHAEQARLAAESAGVVSPLMALKLAMERAEALRMADRIAEANTAFEDAYRQLTALGREETERAGTLLNNWGLVLGRLGRPLEAERMLRRSIGISVSGGSDARVEAISWANLARVLTDLGRYDEALPLAERAIRLARRRGDTVVADQAQLQAARTNVLAGRLDRGAALLDDVEARFRRMFPPTHAAFAAVAIDRVRIALARERVDEASRLADAAVAFMESDPRLGPSIPLALRMRATVRLRAGDVPGAIADAERTLPLVKTDASGGLPSSAVAAAYLTLGEALAAAGRPQDARAALTEALKDTIDAAGAEHPNVKRARAILAGL